MRLSPVLSVFCIVIAATAGIAAEETDDRAIKPVEDVVLSPDEARRELFGVRLAGVTSFSADPWWECVEPDGDTVYSFAGWEQRGRLEISNDAQACFRYDTDNYESQHCFAVTRRGDGYAFWGGGNGLFFTQTVERGVTECRSEGAPIG
ncbi:MAG: hypothetical protein AAF719_06820 [Pseudomonadota bacterium]